MEENGQHKKTRKKEKRLSFWYILGGGVLKEDFILRHTRMIVLLVVLAFFFIGNRYTCMQKLREIDRLQQQLRDVRFEALSISEDFADTINRLGIGGDSHLMFIIGGSL